MRCHELHMPAFPFSLWLLVLLKAVACDGLQSVAVHDLERDRHRRTPAFAARDRPRDRHRFAAGGVEREAQAVDVFVDVLDLQGDASDDRGARVRVIGPLRGVRVDIDRSASDDVSKVELTPPHSRGDNRQTERLAHQRPTEKLTN